MKGAPAVTTASELLAAGDIGRCELVRGELVMMTPAGFNHGRVASKLALLVGRFVSDHDLGITLAAETGFLISKDPDTVRAPDLAFLGKERLNEAPESGFFPGAPDLAVEVVSPSDRSADVQDKVQGWLAAGAVQVWVVDPGTRTVSIHRGRGSAAVVTVFGEHDQLAAGEPLPGLRLRVADIFS